MTPHVLAGDLSLTATGAATITDTQRVDTWLKTTDAIRVPDGGQPPLVDVDARLSEIARWFVGLITTGTRLVVLEGPAYAAKWGQPHERAGLFWRVVRGCHAREIPVAVLTPTELKGYVCGKGNASKEDVRRAVAACYPGQGLARISDDQADAVGLAMAGCDWLGWDGPWLDGRRGTGWLRKARWPERDAVSA